MTEPRDPRTPNTSGNCRLCGRPVSAPYRQGRYGCVDADHTPAMAARRRAGRDDPDAIWHFRPEAVELRRRMATSYLVVSAMVGAEA